MNMKLYNQYLAKTLYPRAKKSKSELLVVREIMLDFKTIYHALICQNKKQKIAVRILENVV